VIEGYLIAAAVGVAAEAGARTGRLWLYRNPLYPVINVLVMFGLVMGGLSLAVPGLGQPACLPAGLGDRLWLRAAQFHAAQLVGFPG